ncbi:MAG: DUF1636 domain-containing protein [Planctomycetota bacterium]|nr:DUF1636 domain-containing protein [Planctomycetota bacterium]
MNTKRPGARFAARLLCCAALLGAPAFTLSACKRPGVPSLSGPGKLHDITQVRRGMSPNEVRRIMGSDYKLIMEEGMQGMDMGIYAWEYPEGRIYFNTEGAFKAEPFR